MSYIDIVNNYLKNELSKRIVEVDTVDYTIDSIGDDEIVSLKDDSGKIIKKYVNDIVSFKKSDDVKSDDTKIEKTTEEETEKQSKEEVKKEFKVEDYITDEKILKSPYISEEALKIYAEVLMDLDSDVEQSILKDMKVGYERELKECSELLLFYKTTVGANKKQMDSTTPGKKVDDKTKERLIKMRNEYELLDITVKIIKDLILPKIYDKLNYKDPYKKEPKKYDNLEDVDEKPTDIIVDDKPKTNLDLRKELNISDLDVENRAKDISKNRNQGTDELNWKLAQEELIKQKQK